MQLMTAGDDYLAALISRSTCASLRKRVFAIIETATAVELRQLVEFFRHFASWQADNNGSSTPTTTTTTVVPATTDSHGRKKRPRTAKGSCADAAAAVRPADVGSTSTAPGAAALAAAAVGVAASQDLEAFLLERLAAKALVRAATPQTAARQVVPEPTAAVRAPSMVVAPTGPLARLPVALHCCVLSCLSVTEILSVAALVNSTWSRPSLAADGSSSLFFLSRRDSAALICLLLLPLPQV